MRHSNKGSRTEEWTPRDRALDYGMVFAAGFGVAATIGALIGFMTNAAVGSAIGMAVGLLGVLSLLSAGLSGGQYTVGGIGRGLGRYNFVRDSFSPAMRRKRFEAPDQTGLIEETSHGYRPEKDPVAFWLAIAGIIYVAAGFVILIASS